MSGFLRVAPRCGGRNHVRR